MYIPTLFPVPCYSCTNYTYYRQKWKWLFCGFVTYKSLRSIIAEHLLHSFIHLFSQVRMLVFYFC